MFGTETGCEVCLAALLTLGCLRGPGSLDFGSGGLLATLGGSGGSGGGLLLRLLLLLLSFLDFPADEKSKGVSNW